MSKPGVTVAKEISPRRHEVRYCSQVQFAMFNNVSGLNINYIIIMDITDHVWDLFVSGLYFKCSDPEMSPTPMKKTTTN